MDYEAEIEIEAGKTYYFGIGTPQVAAPGQNLLNQALAGSSGQQMRPTSALMAGFSGAALYQIDAAEGACRHQSVEAAIAWVIGGVGDHFFGSDFATKTIPAG